MKPYDEAELTRQGSLEYSRTDELNFRAISRASDLPMEQTGLQRYGQTGQSFLNDTTLNQNPIFMMSQDEIKADSGNTQRQRQNLSQT